MRALLLKVLVLFLGGALHAQGDPKPFPVDKTRDLKEPGQVYTVEGRVEIPRNVKISGLRHCTVRGVGGGATLVVNNALSMKAVTGGEVRFENVWLEVSPECKDILLSNASFSGEGGLRTSPKTAARAKMFLIAVKFYGRAQLAITANNGKFEMQNSHSDAPVEIIGAPRSAKAASNVVVQLEACQWNDNGQARGLIGGLKVTGCKDVLVRNCDLSGFETTFVDVPKLTFDGNNARSRTLTFKTDQFGGLKKTSIKNCDVRTKLIFDTPPHPSDPKKAQRLKLDHCWFGGRTEQEAIVRDLIHDQRADPKVGVLCTFAKICPVSLNLGGAFGD